jgi:hypothetical protein
MAADPILTLCQVPPGFGSARGSEHEVWLEPGGRSVIKATHAGECGRKFGPERFATLTEYLRRVELLNAVFAMQWEILGQNGEGRRRRIVTRQPTFQGPPPSRDAIAEFLRARQFGFHRTRYGDAWYRAEDRLLISDAEPKNAVLTEVGVVPFDFLICEADEVLLRAAGIVA